MLPALTPSESKMEDEEAYKLFSLARLKACHEWPYFRSALMSFVPVRVDGYKTAGIDKYGHVYFDPKTFKEWGVAATAGTLAHECGHWLRLHAKRAEAQGVGSKEHDLWNIACDAAINNNLRECGITLPDDLWYPEDLIKDFKLDLDENSAEEEFYFALISLPEKTKQKLQSCNCGSGAHNIPLDHEIGGIGEGKQRGITEVEGNSVRRQVAEDIMNHSKMQGDFPASLLRWAEDTLECKVRWEQQLHATIRQTVAFRSGMNTFTYARPSRRQQSVPTVLLPSMRKPIPKIGIIIDTSGSMSKNSLSRALSETKGVLKSVGRADDVFVLAVDAEVGFAKKVFSTKQVQLTGGGGTDMVAGFNYIREKKLRPNIVILFTDGYTPYPKTPTPYKTVCVLVGDQAKASNVPQWMQTIRVVD